MDNFKNDSTSIAVLLGNGDNLLETLAEKFMEFLEKEDLTLTQPAFTPQGAKNQTSGSHTRRYAWNARSPLLASEEDFRERGRAVRF